MEIYRDPSDAKTQVYRGYGGGFPIVSTMAGGGDSRSPASDPTSFAGAARVHAGRDYAYFGDDAFDGDDAATAGGTTVASSAALNGFPIWQSVLAGLVVWAVTRSIDRFVFGE